MGELNVTKELCEELVDACENALTQLVDAENGYALDDRHEPTSSTIGRLRSALKEAGVDITQWDSVGDEDDG